MRVTSWSFSAWEQFSLCPAQYGYQRVAKLPTKPKPFFEKGNRVHEGIARFIEKKAFGIPLEVKRELAVINELRDLDAPKQVEQKWGFNPDWSFANWKAAHFRVIIDVLVDYGDDMEIIDWKTGKKHEVSHEQMELFSISVLHRFPHVSRVASRLVYLEAGGQDFAEVSRDELPELTAKWEERKNEILSETEFKPRPNSKCGWCDFGASKGGPCRYG